MLIVNIDIKEKVDLEDIEQNDEDVLKSNEEVKEKEEDHLMND